jgi:hypothetical protein
VPPGEETGDGEADHLLLAEDDAVGGIQNLAQPVP